METYREKQMKIFNRVLEGRDRGEERNLSGQRKLQLNPREKR